MMTKRDFDALAKELRATPSRDQYKTWIGCVNAVARVCARSNPKFRVTDFWNACGVHTIDPELTAVNVRLKEGV